MNNSETQECGEQLVFGEFAKACPLPLIPETAESRPEPEPDILCDLQTGGKIAFELTSADDPDGQKIAGDAYKLREEHLKAYNEAVRSGSLCKPDRFVGHTIRVKYREKITTKKKLAAIPQVISSLNTHGPVSYSICKGNILSLKCEPTPMQTNIGPQFHFSTACNVRDYTVEQVAKKLRKEYETDHPIHLLVWSNTGSIPELWEEDLRRNISGNCQFERVWVFVRSGSTIVFDSG